MDSESFWRDVIGNMNPQPTIANPAFVAAQLVETYPLPDWLESRRDEIRDGYYIGLDTPEARQIQVNRLRAAIAPYFEDE